MYLVVSIIITSDYYYTISVYVGSQTKTNKQSIVTTHQDCSTQKTTRPVSTHPVAGRSGRVHAVDQVHSTQPVAGRSGHVNAVDQDHSTHRVAGHSGRVNSVV